MSRHPNVINKEDLEWKTSGSGDRFLSDRKQLAGLVGAKDLGCSMFRVPPGKTAFPNHYHYANEEGIYILEGRGTMRLGEDRVKVGPGDYIAMPTGPHHSHQLINDSQEDLVYLCISTMKSPDVVGYPDSQKMGMIAGSAPGGPNTQDRIAKFFHEDSDVDYFEGET